MKFQPRASQEEILKYTGGTMGISAVPGSGKTHTLSALAAQLVKKLLDEKASQKTGMTDTEILVVTFSNAAATNFSSRIAGFLEDERMIPGVGYDVRTLHSMAAEIVRGRPECVGLDPEFKILEEASSNNLLAHAVDLWLEADAEKTFRKYVPSNRSEFQIKKNYEENWRGDVIKLAKNVISQAKDYQFTPETIRAGASKANFDPTLINMIVDIYESYQILLKSYPAVDFADLMFYAHRILTIDPEYLALLQERWPVILEDEAQDSSMIQEMVLRLLTRQEHNWVRVGDPNQAINETFTTADPKFLKTFLKEADRKCDLQEAGRSARSVLSLANRLIRWTEMSHPNPICRDALITPYIRMTKAGDIQGNPQDEPERIVFDSNAYYPVDEIEAVCRAAAEQVKNHPTETTAILVPSNDFGNQFIPVLQKYPEIDLIEILKSSHKTRDTAQILSQILLYLASPAALNKCLAVFDSLYNPNAEGDYYLSAEDSQKAQKALTQIPRLEDFFYPATEEALEKLTAGLHVPEMVMLTLFSFRYALKRWLEARFLKIDQLILFIAQDLFETSEDLCTASQLGSILLDLTHDDPSMRLDTLAKKLVEIAQNSSIYPGLNNVESQFDPSLYRGKVVLTTYHKAKGLEWDQVYLTSCNSYDFPSGADKGKNPYRAQPFYIRDGLDLQAEALAQLKAIAFPNEYTYQEGLGSREAFNDLISERLRLLYVGITRAKKGIHFSWNIGKSKRETEALAVQELRKQFNSK